MSANELEVAIRKFAEQRAWTRHHRPRSVILAMTAELGELAELLQWVADEDVSAWASEPANRDALGSEMADVYIYLTYLAQSLDVDLEECVHRKLAINERRFPPSK